MKRYNKEVKSKVHKQHFDESTGKEEGQYV